MQSIQLYIGTDRIEMFDDESVSITQSIKNAKDISKVFTTFSREFTVPASKTNNRIFKHYYNYDVVNGFDARSRVDATIELNYLPFRKGKVKLNGVDMRNNKPYAYRLTFFGSVVELKDVLGEDKLFSLDALDIDKDYSAAGVKSALQGVPDSDGCLIPLVTHSQRLYYDENNSSQQSGNLYYDGTNQGVKFRQLKYAIQLKKIIDAIETKYSQINFSTDSFFKDMTTYPDLEKLYMWCHRKKGEKEIVAGPDILVDWTDDNTNSYVQILNDTVIIKAAADGFSQDSLVWYFYPATGFENVRYDIVLYKNGVQADVGLKQEVTGDSSVQQGLTATIPATNFSEGDEFQVFVRTYEEPIEFDQIRFRYSTAHGGTGTNYFFDSTDLTNYPAGYKFNIAENLPEQTIIDFLSSLFKMFNLVAYVQDDDTIQVKPLDTFYGSTEHDITKYVDVNKSSVNAALPYKEIFFKYADTKSILADQHLQELSDVEWGGIEYTDTGNLDGEIYKVEPNFHHAKYERLVDLSDLSNTTGIQYGYFVTDNEEAYLGKPLIMYVNLQAINKSIGLLDRDSVIQLSQNDYVNMPSNTEDIDNVSSNSIHFSDELSEYTNTSIADDKNLFARFYKSYIENVFNPSTRLVKLNAVLPIGKVISIELSDVIVIAGSRYRINAMTTNLKDGRTDFELINYYG